MIRRAVLQDIPALMDIYNEAILHTTATFDTEVKDMENRKAWFAEHNGRYVIYVDVEDGKVAGYASLSRYRDRKAFDPAVEISIYVHKDYRGRGIGRSLMENVLAYAAECEEIDTVISLITSENAASIHLHEAYGFEYCGQIKNAAEIIAGEKDKSELGVTAVDDNTLQVELNAPVSYFTSLMYFPTFYPVNEEFFTSCGDTFATSPETVLSNGAFVLDSYQPAATAFHLTKNADYYDTDRVKLSGLSYQVIQDSQQALMSYQTGALDTTLVNGEQVDQVKDDPEFTTVGAGYLWYVSPNMNSVPELANLNIRLAMTMAIDRDSITADVLKDGSASTYTAVPMQFAAGPDGSDFSEDQTKFSDVCVYDTEKAADYWAKGLEELGESEITLDMVVDADDAPQKVAQVLKEQWETTLPGLTVNLVVEPKKQRVEDMQNGNFQLGLTRWGPDYADPMTYLGMWVTDNSNNYGLWSNADYDAIIDECTTGDLCTDAEGRWARLYDAEKIVMDEAVIYPLYTQCNAEMLSSKVTGVEYHPVAINRVYKDAVKTE